ARGEGVAGLALCRDEAVRVRRREVGERRLSEPADELAEDLAVVAKGLRREVVLAVEVLADRVRERAPQVSHLRCLFGWKGAVHSPPRFEAGRPRGEDIRSIATDAVSSRTFGLLGLGHVLGEERFASGLA